MSTKYPALCPNCNLETLPNDKNVYYDSEWGEYPVKLWRYECSCGWKWANELQRKHNAKEHSKQLMVHKADMYFR